MDDEKKTIDISKILEEADQENERDIAVAEEQRQSSVDLGKTLVAPPITGTLDIADAKGKPDRNLDAATIELIDKYSTKELRDEKSATQDLKDTLAKKLEDEKLRGYLDTKPINNIKNVDELRTKIIDGMDSTESVEKSDSEQKTTDISNRFSDEEVSTSGFEQAEMFPLGDTMTLRESKETPQYADFDRDYRDLGKKVIAGGIPESDRDDGQVAFLPDETDVEPLNPEMDETDVNLRMAFDMMDEKEYEGNPVYTKVLQKKKEKKEMPLLRYTDRAQNAEISGKLKAEKRNCAIRMVVSLLLLVILCAVEFGNVLKPLLSSGNANAGACLYILIDLQLLFLCGFAVLPSLVKGWKGIFRLELTSESLVVFGLFFYFVYAVVSILTGPETDHLELYGVTIAFAIVCLSVSNFLISSKNLHAFRIIAPKKQKYVAVKLESSVKESEEFSRFLYEDSELYTVQKTNFVDGFSERSVKRSKFDDIYNLLLPLILFGGVVLFAVMLILHHTVAEAFRAFHILLAVSIPSTAFFQMSLPLFSANHRGKKYKAAFIGNAIAEEYAMASVLSFADTEVFPSNFVTITSIKNYGGYGLDKVIPEMAKVFSFLGGPLMKVTAQMVDGRIEKPITARVIENVADGVCVAIDGKHIFLGKRSYLKRYHFDAPRDQGDEGYENQENGKDVGSIMYVVIDEQLVAKFYIRYRVNPRFETLLKDLYRAGLCLGLKTMDPNITNEMVMSSIHFKKCPVAVIKEHSPKEISGETVHASSGVVCNSSLHNFLKMFALCDKVRHVTRCNAIITLISVVLSFAAIGFLSINQDLQAFGTFQAAVFQLCWQLPVWVLSFFMI